MVDILSKSTQSLVQNPEVRRAVHTLLDGDKGRPLTVTVNTDGKQVELTRIPPAEQKPGA